MIIAQCYACQWEKRYRDMSEDEQQSYDDNEDGSFLCDECEKNWEIHKEE